MNNNIPVPSSPSPAFGLALASASKVRASASHRKTYSDYSHTSTGTGTGTGTNTAMLLDFGKENNQPNLGKKNANTRTPGAKGLVVVQEQQQKYSSRSSKTPLGNMKTNNTSASASVSNSTPRIRKPKPSAMGNITHGSVNTNNTKSNKMPTLPTTPVSNMLKRKNPTSTSAFNNDNGIGNGISRGTGAAAGIMSSIKKKGTKLLKKSQALTPPRHINVGCKTTTPLRRIQFSRAETPGQKLDMLFAASASASATDSENTSNDENGKFKVRRSSIKHSRNTLFAAPSPGQCTLTLSPKFKNAKQYEIRTSEMDPTAFQVEIPSHESILVNCKLCATMDNYVELGGVDFDFSDLMPWGTRKKKVHTGIQNTRTGADSGGAGRASTVLTRPAAATRTNSEDLHALLMGTGTTGGNVVGPNTENRAGNQMIGAINTSQIGENPILANLHDAVKDIVVEGFFREYYEDPNREDGLGRVEVCVFSSSELNQFYVVFRGSSDVQNRPVNGTQEKAGKKASRDRTKRWLNSSTIHSRKTELNIEGDINSLIMNAYNCGLEHQLFTLLNRLTNLRKFCDVKIIGHSFGGALATIVAHKYASLRPATRIRCNVFGSPRVGGDTFRNDIHTLPNLNIIRVERGSDPFISMPEGPEWKHVGHSLRISQSALVTSLATPAETRPVDFQLHRFDKHRPASNLVTASVNSVNNLRKLKIGNEIKSYQKDLDKVASLNLPWIGSFVGFEVEGIPHGYYA
uniref:Fungal lipase-type domain-containing protein n=1 Tax=Chaetoceros debilis TaxID=122233 RepID=A0A7S3VD90_9STRA